MPTGIIFLDFQKTWLESDKMPASRSELIERVRLAYFSSRTDGFSMLSLVIFTKPPGRAPVSEVAKLWNYTVT